MRSSERTDLTQELYIQGPDAPSIVEDVLAANVDAWDFRHQMGYCGSCENVITSFEGLPSGI